MTVKSLNEGEEILAESLAASLFGDGKGKLLVLMGLPASGKSTLAERLEKLGAIRVNRDAIRKRLYGDESNMGDWQKVNAEYYRELKEAVLKGGVVVSDNVNLTAAHRRVTIEIARERGMSDVSIIFVDVQLETCLERNKARERHVDEKVIRDMHASYVKDGLPKDSEGKLVVLNNGKDREHYVVKTIRAAGEAPPVNPAPGNRKPSEPKKPTAPAPATGETLAKRLQFAEDLRTQVTLFEACVKANRPTWAVETLSVLEAMSQSGDTLFADAPKPSKPDWVPPTPEQITETLLKMIGHRPVVTSEGPLVVLSFNGHLLTKDKAQHMLKPLLELEKRAHIVCFQETNVDAMRVIGRAARYGLNASHRNKREQACGMLFHPRLHWLGKAPVYHDYLLNVPGHPEYQATLRPAVQRRVKDLHSGFILDVLNFHGKSNLGGPDETRGTRRWQFQAMMDELKRQQVKSPYEARDERPSADGKALLDESGWELPTSAVILGGDYNAPIEKAESTEIEPLVQGGFVPVLTPDKRWSYQYKGKGGQFDGFFALGLGDKITECFIPPFWPVENKRDTVFYNQLSDHLPVFVTINVPAKAASADEKPAA